jgi:hypothetical protein
MHSCLEKVLPISQSAAEFVLCEHLQLTFRRVGFLTATKISLTECQKSWQSNLMERLPKAYFRFSLFPYFKEAKSQDKYGK